MPPDPKSGKRRVDAKVLAVARLTWPTCCACEGQGANAHHVVPRGSPHFGDDVLSNLVTLCGSGTSGCHGAHHGSPYTFEIGRGAASIGLASRGASETRAVFVERRDAEWVNRRIGAHLLSQRPDAITYVLQRLGVEPGWAFLERTYYVDLPG